MMIQTIRTMLECRSCSMLGSARITMVESIATISEPSVVTASAIHLYSTRPIRLFIEMPTLLRLR